MAYDWNYRIGRGWPVAGTALVPTYARNVRLKEGAAALRSDLISIAYKHGVNAGTVFKTDTRALLLDIDLAGNTPATIRNALNGINQRLLGGQITVVRADPVNGDVRFRGLVNQDVDQGEGATRLRWSYPIWQLDGFWEEVAPVTGNYLGLTTTGTIGPLLPTGSHPTEPVFTITCQSAGANPKIENPSTGESLQLIGSYAASDVIVVDVPNRNVTVNGTRDKNALRITRGFYFQLVENVTANLDWTASSGTWDVQVRWRPRWR